jgi:hypothetical protein
MTAALPQLHGGRELAVLLVDGTDRGGLGFGDDEHAGRMGVHIEGGKWQAAPHWDGRKSKQQLRRWPDGSKRCGPPTWRRSREL